MANSPTANITGLLAEHRTAYVDFSTAGNSGEATGWTDCVDVPPTDPRANCLTSETWKGQHKPALDIDMPCVLIESSTPGHFHLYIDKEMSWPEYQCLIQVLRTVGILEKGYAEASLERKRTVLRMPGVKK